MMTARYKKRDEVWGETWYGDKEYKHVLRPKEYKRKPKKAPWPKAPLSYGPFVFHPVYYQGRTFDSVPVFVGWLIKHPDSNSGWYDGPFYRTPEEERGFCMNITEPLKAITGVPYNPHYQEEDAA